MAFNKDITLGQFYPVNSFIHALDPRTKLVATGLLLGSILISEGALAIVVSVGICCVALLFSRIPINVFLRNLKPFRWLFLFTFVLNVWGTADTVELFSFAGLQHAFFPACLLCARLALLITLSGLLMLTTQPIDLSDGFRSMFSFSERTRVSASRFAFIMTISLRFLPILMQEAQKLRNSQLSRGLSLDGNVFARAPKLAAMISPLLSSALRRADLLAVSMEARSFDISAGRSSFLRLRWRAGDIVTLIFVFVVFSVALLA